MHHALLAAYRAKNLLPYAAQLADDSEHHAPLLPRVPYRSGKPKLQRQRGQEKLRKRSYSCSESSRFVLWSDGAITCTRSPHPRRRPLPQISIRRWPTSRSSFGHGRLGRRFRAFHVITSWTRAIFSLRSLVWSRRGPAQLYIVSHMGHVSKVTFVSLRVLECTALDSCAFIRVVDPGSRRF
jgi:hypothetical protein